MNTKVGMRNLIYYVNKHKLPNRGDLVGVTPHPSDPAQAFPHTSHPHWGTLMWEGPLPNILIWKWKAWVNKYLGSFISNKERWERGGEAN